MIVVPWCRKRDMSIAADKTEVMIATHNCKEPEINVDITVGGKLKVVKS